MLAGCYFQYNSYQGFLWCNVVYQEFNSALNYFAYYLKKICTGDIKFVKSDIFNALFYLYISVFKRNMSAKSYSEIDSMIVFCGSV